MTREIALEASNLLGVIEELEIFEDSALALTEEIEYKNDENELMIKEVMALISKRIAEAKEELNTL